MRTVNGVAPPHYKRVVVVMDFAQIATEQYMHLHVWNLIICRQVQLGSAACKESLLNGVGAVLFWLLLMWQEMPLNNNNNMICIAPWPSQGHR